MEFSPEELEANKALKEQLCLEAESLAGSTSWRETAERLKGMQQVWKQTGSVPYEDASLLNQRFRNACDTFFQNRTRNYQAQELERIDNLYRKTACCEKAEALLELTDLQEATEQMQELFRLWKEIGPVPREKSDALWERFRAAQDQVYQRKRGQFEVIEQEREGNLKAKLALCAEAEALAYRDDFDETTPLVIELQEHWKGIGPVPRDHADQVWNRFRSACDTYFNRRNDQFAVQDEVRKANLLKREEICQEAVKLKDAVEWHETTDRIKQLQLDWKAAWPVPKEESNQLWETFREACDTFFERKRIHFEEKRKTWQKSQAVWRANMMKLIERKEEEISRLEAAIGFEEAHLEEWQIRLDKLPFELKSVDLKMEIEEKIEKAGEEIQRKSALILQLHEEISEIQQKLSKE
jgi:23S rRNA maturation mini-RNase III